MVAPERDRPEEVPAWKKQAIEREGPFVSRFRELAKELDMAIALTYLEAWAGVEVGKAPTEDVKK